MSTITTPGFQPNSSMGLPKVTRRSKLSPSCTRRIDPRLVAAVYWQDPGYFILFNSGIAYHLWLIIEYTERRGNDRSIGPSIPLHKFSCHPEQLPASYKYMYDNWFYHWLHANEQQSKDARKKFIHYYCSPDGKFKQGLIWCIQEARKLMVMGKPLEEVLDKLFCVPWTLQPVPPVRLVEQSIDRRKVWHGLLPPNTHRSVCNCLRHPQMSRILYDRAEKVSPKVSRVLRAPSVS